MNDDSLVAEIWDRYLTMRLEERQRFLAAYAHELTILARMHFADSEWEAACQCNESLHRIVGHLASPTGERDSNAARSFIEMMIHGAQARGWTPILHRTILGVTRQEARE